MNPTLATTLCKRSEQTNNGVDQPEPLQPSVQTFAISDGTGDFAPNAGSSLSQLISLD
jgi:hypothetical protein